MGPVTFSVPNTTIVDGSGHTLTDTRGLFVLHAIMLHTGKVLCFCGHVELSMYAPLCYLWDPKNSSATLSPIAFPPGADLFCCHYVQILDGRILAAGGSELHGLTGAGFNVHGSTGSKTIALFDPVTEQWTVSKTGGVTNEMSQGRWYPTLVTLPDGRVAVFSGRREDGSGVPAPSIADEVEVLAPPDWSATTVSGATKALPIYPGLHLAPNGKIYFTHTCWGQEMSDPDTASLSIANNASTGSWTNYAGLKPPHPRREEGMSVLLPPAAEGKILVIGGGFAVDAGGNGLVTPGGPGPNGFDHIQDNSDPLQADVMDTTVDPPTWTSVGPMGHGRTNGHSVLLPDATVLICGGHDKYKWEPRPTTNPSLIAEIFTPGTGFRDVAAMGDPRMYHSVALLLPDGRVFTAGGADPNRSEPTLTYPPLWDGRTYGPGMALNSKTFEIYEPPYLHSTAAGSAPVIDDVLRNGASTRRIEYGKTFTVKTAQASDINSVVFMRPAACTHHTDSEQRYVPLTFTKGSGELTVTAVNDAKLAPPGFYMLWIVDSAKRPCRDAVFVQLVPVTGQPGGGTSCFIATAALGSPAHPSVVYLQSLRREFQETPGIAHAFITAVNRVYGRVSPPLADRIRERAAARAAVRQWIVQPTVAVIEGADRITRDLPHESRHAALVALFIVAAIVGLPVLPIVTLAVLIRTVLDSRGASN